MKNYEYISIYTNIYVLICIYWLRCREKDRETKILYSGFVTCYPQLFTKWVLVNY